MSFIILNLYERGVHFMQYTLKWIDELCYLCHFEMEWWMWVSSSVNGSWLIELLVAGAKVKSWKLERAGWAQGFSVYHKFKPHYFCIILSAQRENSLGDGSQTQWINQLGNTAFTYQLPPPTSTLFLIKKGNELISLAPFLNPPPSKSILSLCYNCLKDNLCKDLCYSINQSVNN